MKEMLKSDYYSKYQNNLEMLEIEMELVKRMIQTHLGRLEWEKMNANNKGQIDKQEQNVLAGTRLYSFLLCSWFEARLYKIVYEDSSIAFTTSEISCVMSQKQMDQKWKYCFIYAICKNYGFAYVQGKDYSSDFAPNSIDKENYEEVIHMLNDIEEAITIRNRLAHGQWSVQFNASRKKVASYDFFTKYNNIQQLITLKEIFSLIAEIISDYVVFKDKTNGTRDFNFYINNKVKKIKMMKKRLQKQEFKKYCNSFLRLENKKREVYKEKNSTINSDIVENNI